MADEKEIFDDLEGLIPADARKKYSPTVLDHFLNPRNVGVLKDPDGFDAMSGICGDTMGIYIELEPAIITRIGFVTNGCGPTIACSSAITSMASGRTTPRRGSPVYYYPVGDRDMNKRALVNALREFVQGAVFFGPSLVPLQERAAMERLFILAVFGDTLGIPIFRPYYSLRLFPHVVPRLRPWIRSLLRERDLTDFAVD